jgi:hypothetical protein
MSQQGHAFLPPSGAAAWRLCALWPTMNQQFPELEPSEASQEGTAAHWVWKQLWDGVPVPAGTIAPNGVRVDEEMLGAAELFCSTIHTPMADLRQATLTEVHVTGTRIHPTANAGTPDVSRYKHQLEVKEFKYGHKHVPVFENWQMINYAALLMDRHGVDGIRDQTLEVELTVVQPRNYSAEGPVRTWLVRAADLRPYINDLRNAADRATQPNPTATPGPVQCEYCPGRHACPAVQNTSFAAVDYSQQRALPLRMSPEAVARELSTLTWHEDMLRARKSGLEEQLKAEIKAGHRTPGWHLEAGSGREVWQKSLEEVRILGTLFGVEMQKPALITPTQARAAGVPDTIISSYSVRPPGALKLVQDNEALARRIFGKN